jgi:hypothetical protein
MNNSLFVEIGSKVGKSSGPILRPVTEVDEFQKIFWTMSNLPTEKQFTVMCEHYPLIIKLSPKLSVEEVVEFFQDILNENMGQRTPEEMGRIIEGIALLVKR